MVVINIDLTRTIRIHEASLLAAEATIASPCTHLKKPVSAPVESCYDFGFLLRRVINAYVVYVRLEHLLSSDITERFIEALHDRGISSAHKGTADPALIN